MPLLTHNDPLDILNKHFLYPESDVASAQAKGSVVLDSNTADKKNKRRETKAPTARFGEKDDDSIDSSKRQSNDKSLFFFVFALIESYHNSYFNQRFSQFSCCHLPCRKPYILIRVLLI